MSIIQEQIEEVQGFEKEIDQGAIGLILDNLQLYQYEYPQKSAIRELVSNGLDAIREKQIALEILSGKSKVEDYFIRRNDALNGDSNFDPGYYDRDWLYHGLKFSSHTLGGWNCDKVYVTYEEGGDIGKDRVIIEDFGVGMGAGRIEGYFKIGYSTKRNTKEALGKFGIGAKAGLSTAPFYTMISRYNGREYAFNVYPHNVQSTVPKWDLETGKENGTHMFSNGKIIYYRKTHQPNGVRVELESKKHHKQLFVDAVKSQLLYFPNVEFRIRNSSGGMDVVPIQAKIIYEDEHILLSDNTQFSRPHVLISRINYGVIDFRELELDDVKGNIAFKIPQEEVTIKPSRESLVWNEVTRGAVMSHFQKIKAIAESMVAQQLKEEDFIEWLKACSQVQTRYAVDSVVGRLSQLVDMSNAKIPYSRDASIVYNRSLFEGLQIRVNTLDTKREGSSIKYKIDRSEHGILTSIADGMPIYIQYGNTSFKTDKYLLMGPDKEVGFITIRDPFYFVDEKDGEMTRGDDCPTNEYIVTAAKEMICEKLKRTHVSQVEMSEHGDEAIKAVKTQVRKVLDHLSVSPHVRWYDKVKVPEGFDSKEEVEDEKTIEEVQAKEARKKIEREKGIIPIFTPRNVETAYINDKDTDGTKLYEWQKIELPVSDIDKWDEEEVFFGNDKDQELLHLAAMITRPSGNLTWSAMNKSGHVPFAQQNETFRGFVKRYFDGFISNYSSTDLIGRANRNAGSYITNPNFTENTPTDQLYNLEMDEAARCHNFFETFGKPRVKLVKVAMDRVKFFLDFKPVQRFFMDIKNKTLTMSNALIRWNTGRIIEADLGKLRFLRNFAMFHPQYTKWYYELVEYASKYYRNLADHKTDSKYFALKEQTYDDLVSHMDKVTRFQLFVRDNPTEADKIAELARTMFNPSTEITDGLAVEVDKLDKLKELLDFASPIATLLNDLNALINSGTRIPQELETEIRFYIDTKGVKL